MCTEKRLSVGNTFFEKKGIHKITWVSGVDDRKSLLDLIVVQEEEKNKLLDVNVLRGAGGGISDHHLVIAKVRCLKRWTGRMVNMESRYEIKVSELRKVTRKIEYEDKLNQQWERFKQRQIVGKSQTNKERKILRYKQRKN